MRDGWRAFLTGLSYALQYRRGLLILFVITAVNAALLTANPTLSLVDWLGQRPAVREAADGLDAWMVIETLFSAGVDASLGQDPDVVDPAQQTMLLGLLTLAVAPLIAWLPNTFLKGGLLLVYAEAPQETSWSRFLWGCWHWFGAFLLLGGIQVLLSAILLAGLLLAGGALLMAGAGPVVGLLAPLALGLALMWRAGFGFARVVAVVEGTRNVLRLLAQGARFVLRHAGGVLALEGLAFLLVALLAALYAWGVRPALPWEAWTLVLVVQQVFVLAQLWARLSRLAGRTALYRRERE
jgi:hypothetical protein